MPPKRKPKKKGEEKNLKRKPGAKESKAKRVREGSAPGSDLEDEFDDELDDEEMPLAEEEEDEEEEEEDEGGEHDVGFAAGPGDAGVVEVVTRIWITVIDVGQGESTLIRYQEQRDEVWVDLRVILVDGGRTHFAAHSILPTLTALGVARVHAVVCTHYDADHIEGLTAFGAMAGGGTTAHLYERAAAARGGEDKVRNLRARYAGRSSVLELEDEILRAALPEADRAGAPTLTCVAVDNHGARPSEENEASIALLLHFQNFKFFLGGDLTEDGEDPLGDEIGHICALKCGHHGSKHSSSRDFLDAITPSAAFISAASHSYCHPDDDTIGRLCATGSLHRCYLTNCVYNRGGVNPGFAAQEDVLLDQARARALAFIDDQELDDFPIGFENLKDLRGDPPHDVNDFNAMLAGDLELTSTNVRAKYPDDADTRSAWNEIARLYYSALDIRDGRDARAARRQIGDVAGSGLTLGNVHIVATAAEATNQVFNVYRHGPVNLVVGHRHRCGVGAPPILFPPPIPAAPRGGDYDAPFSLLTGPSGEVQALLTPEEVFDYTDQLTRLYNRVAVTQEWGADVVEAGMEDELVEGEPFSVLYHALQDRYVELLETQNYNLKEPAVEIGNALEILDPDEPSASEFEPESEDF